MNLGAVAMHRRDAAIAVASAVAREWDKVLPMLMYGDPVVAFKLLPLVEVFARVDKEFIAASTPTGVT